MSYHRVMAKRKKEFTKGIKFFVFVVIILLLLSAGFFVYKYFNVSKTNNYIIKNKYYGFELKTPKNWIAQENTTYSEDNIAQVLQQCKSDKLSGASNYEIGAFEFEDQRYPNGFGTLGYFPVGAGTGAIFKVSINCIPGESNANKNIDYEYGNLKIGGKGAFEDVVDLYGFGKTKYFFLSHNNFQYEISEDVFVSPQDKKNEAGIRDSYDKIFNEIISSFKFR